MRDQHRIIKPQEPRRREELAPTVLPEQAAALEQAQQELDVIDQILAEEPRGPASARSAHVIGAPADKPLRRASTDEEFIRAFRQESGE